MGVCIYIQFMGCGLGTYVSDMDSLLFTAGLWGDVGQSSGGSLEEGGESITMTVCLADFLGSKLICLFSSSWVL